MPPEKEDGLTGEVFGPDEHLYDSQDISPKDFLLAIMRDKRVPLSARMEAARNAAIFEHPRLAQVSQDLTTGLTIKIEGGLPALPGTNVIMPNQPSAPKTNGSGRSQP